jgi:hypothetical protein
VTLTVVEGVLNLTTYGLLQRKLVKMLVKMDGLVMVKETIALMIIINRRKNE